YYTETDFYGGYAPGARLIQLGRIDPARYGVVGPVYDMFLALVDCLTRNPFVAASAISIVSAVSALLLWFALLRRRIGAVPALAVYLAGFAALSLPWLLFALRSGTAPGSMLFHDLAYDIYAQARGQTWADYQTRLQPGFHSLMGVLFQEPAAVLHREGANLL